jgi:hypothetical protein
MHPVVDVFSVFDELVPLGSECDFDTVSDELLATVVSLLELDYIMVL